MKINRKTIAISTFLLGALLLSACGDKTEVNVAVNTANKANTATVVNTDTTKDTTVSESTPKTESKTELHTPAKDSAERTEIMDALRVPVSKELKQDVIFNVDKLNVQGDWAFLSGKPKNKDGGEPNWKITKYQESIDNDDFEEGIYALLNKKAGKWEVVTYMMNCTDVCYLEWDKEFKAPSAILK